MAERDATSDLYVRIRGPQGSGKSAAARIIADALFAQGATVHVEDDDVDYTQHASTEHRGVLDDKVVHVMTMTMGTR